MILLRAPPHEFSIDSRSGQSVADPDHISVELSGGPGRRRSHIYFQEHGSGVTKYDNISVMGESVFSKVGKQYVVDSRLCTGNWTLAGSTGGTTTTTTTTTTTSANSGNRVAGSSAGSGSRSSSTYSAWEWDDQYQKYRRYNYQSQHWEWQ
jgi:hypothetical protein